MNITQVILQPGPQACLIDNPSLVDSRLYQVVMGCSGSNRGRGLGIDPPFIGCFPGTTGCGGALEAQGHPQLCGSGLEKQASEWEAQASVSHPDHIDSL